VVVAAKKILLMSLAKSIWTSLSGSVSSIIPMFFTVCKSGVCTVACVSPIASILGISSASLIASPLTQSLFPVLLAISAVSFTVSYYKLYVLPKYAASCAPGCECAPTKKTFQQKFALGAFWIGLLASTFFFSYFEYQNYKANTAPKAAIVASPNTNETNTITPADTTEAPCCAEGQTCE
jgi:hypothetical protein